MPAVKELLALGRPCVGWPRLPHPGTGCLTTVTLALGVGDADEGNGSSAAGLVIQGSRQGLDPVVCSSLAALPLRAVDCVLLLLGGDVDEEEDGADWAAAASALAEIGRGVVAAAAPPAEKEQPRHLPLVFVVAPGRVTADDLGIVETAAAPWGMEVATLRQLSLPSKGGGGGAGGLIGSLAPAVNEDGVGPYVLEAAAAVCRGQKGRGFVVVQLQARGSPWEAAAAGDRSGATSGDGTVAPEEGRSPSSSSSSSPSLPPPSPSTRLLRLVETSLFLAQPPSPPDAPLAAEDTEYLRPPPPAACALHLSNYYDDWRGLYPGLQALLEDFEAIRAEALSVAQWTPWPEYHFRDGGAENDWRVVPFLHTFPASDPGKSVWIEGTGARCPRTVAALARLRPHVRTALFSRLGPDTRLSAHTGWEDLANHVLRVHLTLAAPKGPVCGTWVEGEVRCHRPRDFIVFDDSKVHKAFNLHPTEARVVLILDMARPPEMARGVAVGGHTAELDAFISAFR